jgi:mRNA interferase YafQ
MRTIERTAQFKRDYKRESKGRHRDVLDSLLMEVLMHLVHRKRLQIKYRDHALSGPWEDHRDCHLRPDLVLIYRLPDDNTLQLVRLGSHSELGL